MMKTQNTINTGDTDTRIDLEALLPNSANTIIAYYKEKGRMLWLVIDRSKKTHLLNLLFC